MKKIIIAAALILLLTPQIGQTAPGETTTYLLQDPVTMFDWGMERISRRFNMLKFKNKNLRGPHAGCQVDYDWDKDQIVIDITVFQKAATTKSVSPRELCKQLTKELKEEQLYFGIRGAQYSFGRNFLHAGIVKKNAPSDLAEKIDAAVVITVTVWVSKTGDDKPPFAPAAKSVNSYLQKGISVEEF